MKIAAGIYLKERITLNDILSVVKYSKEAQESPKRGDKIRAMKQIIRALTSRRYLLNLRDVYYLPKILEAAAMRQDKKADAADDIEKSILRTASGIGAKCNKLPFEILTGMTLTETEIYSMQLLAEKYEAALSMVYAYHSPGEYSKEMNKRLQESTTKILNFARVIVTSDREQSEAGGFVAPREVFALMGNVG